MKFTKFFLNKKIYYNYNRLIVKKMFQHALSYYENDKLYYPDTTYYITKKLTQSQSDDPLESGYYIKVVLPGNGKHAINFLYMVLKGKGVDLKDIVMLGNNRLLIDKNISKDDIPMSLRESFNGHFNRFIVNLKTKIKRNLHEMSDLYDYIEDKSNKFDKVCVVIKKSISEGINKNYYELFKGDIFMKETFLIKSEYEFIIRLCKSIKSRLDKFKLKESIKDAVWDTFNHLFGESYDKGDWKRLIYHDMLYIEDEFPSSIAKFSLSAIKKKHPKKYVY